MSVSALSLFKLHTTEPTLILGFIGVSQHMLFQELPGGEPFTTRFTRVMICLIKAAMMDQTMFIVVAFKTFVTRKGFITFMLIDVGIQISLA